MAPFDLDNITAINPETNQSDNKDDGNGPVWVPFAEPVPDWEEARAKWGIWWHIHIYGVGILFFTVSIFTLVNIIALFIAKKLPQKAYFIALNILVFIFATERGVFMFVDAYNIQGTLHPTVAYLFLSIGLPCMTSAFYLIFIAWIKATKMEKVNSIHRTRTMVVIISVHFVVSVVFDLVAGFTIHAVYLLICCQVVFIILSCVLAIMYFYLYVRIYKRTVVTRRDLARMSAGAGHKYERPVIVQDKQARRPVQTATPHNIDHSTSLSIDGQCTSYTHEDCTDYGGHSGEVTQPSSHPAEFSAVEHEPDVTDAYTTSQDEKIIYRPRKQSNIPEAKVPLGAKLILVTAILLIIIACLYLAGIFGCYTLQVISGQNPEAWSWWAYELALRLCEIALCWTISVAATRPITQRFAKQVSLRVRNSKRKLVQSFSVKGTHSIHEEVHN